MKVEAFADADSARARRTSKRSCTIRHEEREASAELEKGTMTEPAIVARTEVDLERVGGARAIWSDSLSIVFRCCTPR